MLALLRRFLNTWAARLFFLVLVGSFAAWGVGDVIRNVGNDSAVARIGDRKIEPQELQVAYRRALPQVMRMIGLQTEPTPQIRQGVAEQALAQLLTQSALDQDAARMGLAVPDETLRQTVYGMREFQVAGQFSKPQFDTVLRQNNYTESSFLDALRGDLLRRQLLVSARSGVAAADVIAGQVFAFQKEARVGSVVELPFAGATQPPDPTEADLQRQYDNNPDVYSAPEYRRIKAIILAPETLARSIDVSDAEIQAYYDAHRADYLKPQRRSVQVVIAPEEAKARALAQQWTGGADWPAVEAAAKEAGVSTVTLDDATQPEIPDVDLGRAVFAAPAESVQGPVHGALGWYVVRVTKVTPGSERTLAEARDEIHGKIALDKAGDQLFTNANKVEDALSGGATLDEMPNDLGLAPVLGTLDAQGNTPQGEPAPLPGGPALRQALVAAAFQAKKGDAPVLTEAPDHSWYAVTVEDQTAPTLKPFADVQAELRDDWLRDTRRHEQETIAAKLMAGAQGGQSLDDAATVAGLRMEQTPPVVRGAPVPGVSPQLAQALFGLKKGETTMVETPEGFVVTTLAEIRTPEPSADPAGYAQAKAALTTAIGNDVEAVFAGALRDRMKPTINHAAVAAVVQP